MYLASALRVPRAVTRLTVYCSLYIFFYRSNTRAERSSSDRSSDFRGAAHAKTYILKIYVNLISGTHQLSFRLYIEASFALSMNLREL